MDLGLLRSILIYYGQPHKLLRLVTFYRQFIRPGDLCFDVGAHVGNRIWAWRRLGARVVALEPQSNCMRFLRLLYARSLDVTLLEQAAGAFQGKQNLYVSRRNPTVSSLSPSWIDAVQEHPSFSHVHWEAGQVIPVTTLDTLIEQYGEPAFCKIDVEGYEREVLQGLSKPLKALSFEYLPLAIETALDCVARLGELGNFEYNWSVGETHGFGTAAWISPAGIVAFLRNMTSRQPQGDIYARFVEISQV